MTCFSELYTYRIFKEVRVYGVGLKTTDYGLAALS